MDLEDDRWETWGIAARWDSTHGWHDPSDLHVELRNDYAPH